MWLVILIVLSFVAISIGGIYWSKKAKETYSQALRSEGFNIEQSIEIGDYVLYVDDTNKKWSIKYPLVSSVQTYKFSDLIEFEIIEDGGSITKGRAGSALVGGILFGAAGAVIGASRRKIVEPICRTLQLRITVDDIDNPEITIYLINKETKKDSYEYTSSMESCRKVASKLSYIQNDGKKVDVDLSGSVNETTEDKIRQLSKLRDDGLLSAEEHDEKKRELLSRM